jgi:membrane protease YdiL (CAAX protease family)
VSEETTVPAAAGDEKKKRKRVGIPEGTWRPIHVLWGILALLGLTIVEGIGIAIFDPDLESLAAKLVAQAMLAVTLVFVSLGFASMPGSGLAEPRRLGLRSFRPSGIGWAFAVFAAYIAIAGVYSALVQPDQEDVARDLGFDESTLGAIASGILIIGVAPPSEELFFRGFVFGGLRRRLPLLTAALASGAIFGIFHFTGEDSLAAIPQLAILGAMLAWLYEKTGSLWPPIILHALNNGIAFIFITSS